MRSLWQQWLRGRNHKNNQAPRARLGVHALEGRVLLSASLHHAVVSHPAAHAVVHASPVRGVEVHHQQQADSPDTTTGKDHGTSGSTDKGTRIDRSADATAAKDHGMSGSTDKGASKDLSPDTTAGKDNSIDGSTDKGTGKDQSPDTTTGKDTSPDDPNGQGTDTSSNGTSDGGSGSTDSPDHAAVTDLMFASLGH